MKSKIGDATWSALSREFPATQSKATLSHFHKRVKDERSEVGGGKLRSRIGDATWSALSREFP